MATEIVGEFTTWSSQGDDKGHRDYQIQFKIKADGQDGPYNVRNTEGLPLPGAPWDFREDYDPAAKCKQRYSLTPVQRLHEETDLWLIDFFFSTRPDDRCQDEPFQDPLTEPQKLSGSWTKYKEEAVVDRFGESLRYSSHERIKGPQIEFDSGLPTVRIEQNVKDLELDLVSQLMHTVNVDVMWDLPPRCVKLSGFSWSQHFQGDCDPYFTRVFEFEINPNTFDRDLTDEGTKVLYGRWERPGVYRILCVNGDVPDHKNPSHFIPFKSPDGTPGRVILNGKGLPAGACIVWDECHNNPTGKSAGCPDDALTEVRTLTTSGSYTQYYISPWENNQGNRLSDSEMWVNIVGIMRTEWQPFLIYVRGNVVRHNNITYLAMAPSRGIEPGSGIDSSASESYWLALGPTSLTGTGDIDINDRGVFDICTNYNMGDYVTETSGQSVITGSGTDVDYSGCDRTRPGAIRVEKYAEADLLLLGIPAELK